MPFFRRKKRRKQNFSDVDLGDVFFDAQNVSSINKKNFDDVIETPLKKKSFFLPLILFSLVFIIFLGKVFYLQVINGDKYKNIAKNNNIKTEVIFEKRGIIKDRNGVLLAWNKKDENIDFFKRMYLKEPGMSHLVGYIKYPKKDKKDIYYQVEYAPKTGVEKVFNERLQGRLGKVVTKVDAGQNSLTDIYKEEAVFGENITLSIDSKTQTLFSKHLGSFVDRKGFSGGAVVVMDIYSGELVVATSYPEYNQNVLTDGSDYKLISSYFKDKRRPSLPRFSYGTYAPGSVMKVFVAMAALEEKIVSAKQIIHTEGKLVIKGRGGRYYTFYDWTNHGNINIYSAIANSSNAYFYIMAGGYRGFKGLGIDRLSRYYKDFGFGKKTGIFSEATKENDKVGEKNGVVPDREWKKKVFKDDWYLGNTYYTAIGQFGVLVTPLQIVSATAALANDGEVLVPKLEKNSQKEVRKSLGYSQKNFNIIKRAMRGTVLYGTAKKLNYNFIHLAAKTGTAEIGPKRDRVNSLISGFFPYENPRYAFVVLGENGPANEKNSVSNLWGEMIWDLYDKDPGNMLFKK